MSRAQPAAIWIGAIAALGCVAGTAPAGHAAGFGPVRSLSPAAGAVDMPKAAVAPNGETVVMWRRIGSRTRDFQYVAAVGRNAGSLRRPAIVRAGRQAAVSAADSALLARPDGGFVACFNDLPAPGAAAVLGCSFSTASGRFGPLRVVARRPRRERASFRVAMRPDGKLAVVLARRVDGGKQLRAATLDARGTRGPFRTLATIPIQVAFDIATTDDGTTAVAWTARRVRERDANWGVFLRLADAGRDVFDPPLTVVDDAAVGVRGAVRLQGGRELQILVKNAHDDFGGERTVRRFPDGSFSAPLGLPRPGPGALSGPVVSLPDGSPLAVSVAEHRSEQGCPGLDASTVGFGPLVADPTQSSDAAQRLSKPGQVAFDPAAATLADGTVIASWHNGDPGNGPDTRIEAAIRPPGADRFPPSQVLPGLAVGESALAAAGDQAVLAWVVRDVQDGPSQVVVSSLRRSPPYATPARLPKWPQTPCW